MVTFYKRFEHLQGMTAKELNTFYYDPIFIPLAGHGVHWLNEPGFRTLAPGGTGNTNKVEGINVPADGSEIKALFYGSAAIPLFMSVPTEQFFAAVDAGEDWTTLIGPSDYPFGDAWKDQRVAAYYQGPDPFFEGIDHPPKYFQGASTMKEAMMNPDMDPCATPEHVINYGKRVPPFFYMNDNHSEETCDDHDGGH